MCTVAEDLDGVVAVGDELLEVARGAVEDRVRPDFNVVSPLLADLAVVLDDAAFESGGVNEGIDAAVDELIDSESEIFGGERRRELVEAGGMASVVVEEDFGLSGGGGGSGMCALPGR